MQQQQPSPTASPVMSYQGQGGVEIPAASLGVPDHQGNPPAADAPPACAPPPPEIGTLLSAETVTGRVSAGIGGSVVLVLVGLFAISITAFLALPDLNPRTSVPSPWGYPIVAAVIGLCVLLGWRIFRRWPGVTYVGEDGVASYTANGKGVITKRQVLLFAEATALFTGSTRHYYNGVYTGTSYTFRWDGVIDGRGRALLKLAGRHNSKVGTPKAHDPWYFGRMAELVWSNHLLDRCQAELSAQRFIQFRVNGADYVRVGHGTMEFHFGSRTERINAADIATIKLDAGVFHVASKDAKWLSRAGKFNFNYAKMANARVFLLAVDKLVGIRFG